MRLDELIASSSAPYDWNAQAGDTILGSGRYPDLIVTGTSHADVKRIRWHVVECAVESEPQRGYIVGRLVAELEDGREVEVGDRICIPREVVEHQTDTTKCVSCGRSIVSMSGFEIIDGLAYCQICAYSGTGCKNA